VASRRSLRSLLTHRERCAHYAAPVELDEVLATMRAFYDDGPLGSVSWPDPFRPEGPPEEAYSRVTDPDRY